MNQTDPIDVLARTIYGEARNQGIEGMQCVASVVLNRVGQPSWWGNDICSVCLHPYQFSCWNENDPNRAIISAVDASDAIFSMAVTIAQNAVNGTLEDQTGGATMYKAIGTPAEWAVGKTPCFTYKQHEFYNLPPNT